MKGLFKLIGAVFTFQLGAVAAMLFAQRSGKSLRKDLQKSKNPLETLFKEGLKIDKEILKNVQDWAENSESIQELRDQLGEVKGQAKDMTDETRAEMQKKLETVSKEAKSAADDLKKTAKKKVITKANATKKATTKTVKKKTAAAKKVATKKVAATRKTASKTVKKAAPKKK